jgi:hypothetical protein
MGHRMSGEIRHIDRSLRSEDLRRIRAIAPGVSPRHIAAWMRLGGVDVDRLRRLAERGLPYEFEVEVAACVRCIRARPTAFSERLASGELDL